MFKQVRPATLAMFLASGAIATAFAEPAARTATDNPFGIHGPQYSHWLRADKVNIWQHAEARLQVLEDSGAGWARQDFWWSLVEPEPGRFEWNAFDRAVESYAQHDVKLLAILCYGASWGGGDAPLSATEQDAFAKYVYEMVNRYQGKVAAWEIWNEPNILPFWSPRPDAQIYTQLLKKAYAAAKRADPDCVILGGAMAGPDVKFLRGMYKAGAADYFDVLSYHNYGQYNEIETEWPAIEEMRAVMAKHGDSDKPIWHTETGFYTGPVGLGENEQAARIVRYSIGLLALGIERTFQLTLNDWTDDPDYHDKTAYRGLTRLDYNIKPAYRAYQTMCDRLAGKPFTATIRPHPGTTGYLFGNDDDAVLVLWRPNAEAPKPIELDLGAPVILLQTLTGDWALRQSESHKYSLMLGKTPLYVLRPGPTVLRQQHVRWPNPVQSTIAREANASLAVRVTVEQDAATQETMTLSLSCSHSPRILSSIELTGIGTHNVRVPIDASKLSPGVYEFQWTLAGPAHDKPYAQGHRQVIVESPLSISFAPLTRLRPDQPELAARLDYAGSSPTTAEVGLRVAGLQVAERTDVTLAPRDVTEVPLPLPVAALADTDAPISLDVRAGDIELRRQINKRLLRCPPAPADVSIDGALDEWTSRPPQVRPSQMRWEYVNADETPAPEDLQVRAWVAYGDAGIYVAVEAHDDHIVPARDRAVWNWDSLQVALDLASDARPNSDFDDNDVEIELGGGGDNTWCYMGACPPGWPHDALAEKLRGAVQADPMAGRMTYELLIPAALITNAASLEPDTVMGFSFLVNDNDGGGRAGWQELTPGIGIGKMPAEYVWLWLRGGEND